MKLRRRNREQRVERRFRPPAGLARAGAYGSSLALGMGPGAAWLEHLFPADFRVIDLAIEGHERADAANLARLAGLQPGDRWLAVDAEAVADAIDDDPWVRQARVAKWPPGEILVAVEERVPVAVAVLDDGSRWLVDREGVAFAPAPPNADGPLLLGARGAGVDASDPLLAQGIRLLVAVRDRALPAPTAVRLRGDDPLALPALEWAPYQAPIQRALLGGGDAERKLDRLERLLAAEPPELAGTGEVDLRFGERLVLRRPGGAQAGNPIHDGKG